MPHPPQAAPLSPTGTARKDCRSCLCSLAMIGAYVIPSDRSAPLSYRATERESSVSKKGKGKSEEVMPTALFVFVRPYILYIWKGRDKGGGAKNDRKKHRKSKGFSAKIGKMKKNEKKLKKIKKSSKNACKTA